MHCYSITTVELLIKATPDVRTPLYKGHFTESQMHCYRITTVELLIKATPDVRTPPL